jgi:ABC-type multidrug transport system fused ATPase/permease subunit
LLKLLMGFYPPAVAISCCGGSDRVLSWRPCAARSPTCPDEYLFTGTIAENIGYGRPGASAGEIEAAARAALAHDFIEALPGGYETPVGERGAQLSGGQRQRVAIARALLKDAPILLLDEATASLDSQSERLVQQALERLMAGRTVIVVAHRLSTVRNANYILVLEDGRIVERGSHRELLRARGRYAYYYRIQFAGREKAAEPGEQPDLQLT